MMHAHAVDSERNTQAPWAHFSLCPFSQIAIRVMKLVNNDETPFAQVSSSPLTRRFPPKFSGLQTPFGMRHGFLR